MSTLAAAIKLTEDKFFGVKDKGGEDYYKHCETVMLTVKSDDDDVKMIAVMHDLIEDTDVTAEFLVAMGFNKRVVAGVVCMTHLDGESYMDYIQRISLNADAILCKRADLEHNSLIFRMKSLRKKDFDRLQKYFTAYEYLRGC